MKGQARAARQTALEVQRMTTTEAQPSHFATHLSSGEIALALEITPPQKMLPRVLQRRAHLLGNSVDVINVIQRPDRISSLDAAIALQRSGIDAVWHLATRGSTLEELATQVARAREGGIRHVLCLLGEHAVNAPAGAKSPTVRESVVLLREQLPGAMLGVTFNQYAAEQPKAMSNLVAKLHAGAAYIQTQPVFAPESFLETIRAIRREYPGIPVVPMVLPLLTPEAVDRIQRRLRITIPLEYREAVAEGPERAWEAFAGVISTLVASGEVNGLAVMTFQMDAAAEDGRHIARILAESGVRRAAPAAHA